MNTHTDLPGNPRRFNVSEIMPLAILAAVLCGCSTSPAPKGVDRDADGWKDLFDGHSLTGWVQRGGQADYKVENGCIVGSTRPHQPNSFLCTEEDFGNFVLEFDFKVDPELNSGVQFRSLSSPDYQNGRVHGYQFEIDPSARSWTAGIYDEGRKGWLRNLENNPGAKAAFKKDQWNHARILAQGDHLQTWLNGVPAADIRDATTASGFIALQVHDVGNRQDPLRVQWRNIRINQTDLTAGMPASK